MSDVENFIELIRDWKHHEALQMLNSSPDLATARSDREDSFTGLRHCSGQTKQTPLDAANEYKNTYVAAVLRKHGALAFNPPD